MGSSRFVRPETKTIHISDGDWLLVKKRLSAGEQRATLARLYVENPDGRYHSNPLQTGIATITAFLLDWSLTDEDGKPVVIRGLSVDDLVAVLDALDLESFAEIKDAINEHENAMIAERAAEKKTRSGVRPSSATSSSLHDSISIPSALPNSTPMCTPSWSRS